MLQVLARTLRNAVWPADFVGSWSEAQFLVILSGCDEDALQSVSQRVLKMMASAAIPWWGEELSAAFPWDAPALSPAIPSNHFCSGRNPRSAKIKPRRAAR